MLKLQQDNRTNSFKSVAKYLVVKFGLAAVLSAALFGSLIHANTPTTYAATNAESTIREVFGPYANQALRIAQCESTMNPNAVNSMAIGNSHAQGLFQILYPSTWSGTSQAAHSPIEVQANVRAAYDLFRADGYTWREWQCKP